MTIVLSTEDLTFINAAIAGISANYNSKPTVPEDYLHRYARGNIRFGVFNETGNRFLKVICNNSTLFDVHLGPTPAEVEPDPPLNSMKEASA